MNTKYLDVIKAPVVTEKAAYAGQNGVYSFYVDPKSNKTEIKLAIEKLFNVKVKDKEEVIETGLRKFSAVLGNHVEVGCNSVVCPGSVIGENSNVYPLTMVRGIIEPNRIVKDMNNIVEKGDR